MTATAPKRRIGRPTGKTDTRDVILDAAEGYFADGGFNATSMREVAEKAGVNQALITYYFKSKRGLYEAVFSRRAQEMVDERDALLAGLLSEKPDSFTAREVIAAYLKPQFDMLSSGEQGEKFVRIQARLHNEPEEVAFKLRSDTYDEVTKKYIAALAKVLPHLSYDEVTWRMTFLIGTYLFMLSGVDRLGDLSDGKLHAGDAGEVVTRLVAFLEGGLQAPSSE